MDKLLNQIQIILSIAQKFKRKQTNKQDFFWNINPVQIHKNNCFQIEKIKIEILAIANLYPSIFGKIKHRFNFEKF